MVFSQLAATKQDYNKKGGNDITWQHLIKVYTCDVDVNNVPCYEKLTDANFLLDNSAKMRNYPTKDV